ncbi:hypothetical protein GDO78_020851 [Eleutherodactylus coqui]|uniref:Uncharacterized protein n=1 Tax=Eleutherodactylus coqui TaxID=57060 RepID=A0A8J6EHJ1_ELECQ|nr:hypothetical protein GDO78_020851 [Eleutherodactylus coqui]
MERLQAMAPVVSEGVGEHQAVDLSFMISSSYPQSFVLLVRKAEADVFPCASLSNLVAGSDKPDESKLWGIITRGYVPSSIRSLCT